MDPRDVFGILNTTNANVWLSLQIQEPDSSSIVTCEFAMHTLTHTILHQCYHINCFGQRLRFHGILENNIGIGKPFGRPNMQTGHKWPNLRI